MRRCEIWRLLHQKYYLHHACMVEIRLYQECIFRNLSARGGGGLTFFSLEGLESPI